MRTRPLYAYGLTDEQWDSIERRVDEALAVRAQASWEADAVRNRIAYLPVILQPPDPDAPIPLRDLPISPDRPTDRGEFVAWLRDMTPTERRTWYVDAVLAQEAADALPSPEGDSHP